MQTAPELRRRILSAQWASHSTTHLRATIHKSALYRNDSNGKGVEGEHDAVSTVSQPKKQPLIQQLFPEETKRYETAKREAGREVPRLPLQEKSIILEKTAATPATQHQNPSITEQPLRLWTARRSREEVERNMRQSGVQTSVLVLRNASLNLVEEDFRRLIPRGKHMEGWTMEQGDILKIIPGRDLATLAQQNYYYLLFSSQLSAFAYQGHATRIFHLAAAHTPSSILSPIAAPKGYTVDGIDVHDAIESFALVPPSQKMELRQLREPLSPLMKTIIQYQGYPSLVKRDGKMPFEVRLTLEGPQLQASTIRWILHASGKARALPWSGGDEIIPKITKWELPYVLSPLDHEAWKKVEERTEDHQARRDAWKAQRLRDGNDGEKRRTHLSVHIIGFHTEHAAQTFLRFWHRRPMTWEGSGNAKEEDDLPPIANVEMLW